MENPIHLVGIHSRHTQGVESGRSSDRFLLPCG